MNKTGLLKNLLNHRGTYILVIRITKRITIPVGKLSGTPITFARGYYLYCGSALGKNGLFNRVRRHLSQKKKIRWHIDYLLAHGKVIDVIYNTEPVRRECDYAGKFLKSGFTPVRKFGSSDCNCVAHLYYSPKKPPVDKIRISATSKFEFCS